MGNANPATVLYREINETDDADRFAQVLATFTDDDEELLSMADLFYHNACVKCLRLIQHRYDGADAEVKDKWLIKYHKMLECWLPYRVTPELIELIEEHYEAIAMIDQQLAAKRGQVGRTMSVPAKFTSTTRPETLLGLAIYYDDVARAEKLIEQYPDQLNDRRGGFLEVINFAWRLNHQGRVTAPKIVARFPQYMSHLPSFNDLMAVIEKEGLNVGHVAVGQPSCQPFVLVPKSTD